MNLPFLSATEFLGKRVLVRADLDLGEGLNFPENELLRLQALVPTLNFLADRRCSVTIIGHRGRPDGREVPELSLKPVETKLHELLPGVEFRVLENLRFDPREEANDEILAKMLAGTAEMYVNDAFANSHREHCSISALPKLMKAQGKTVVLGLRFEKEIGNLSKVLVSPRKPVIFVISGLKKDKLDYIQKLANLADKVLVGGRLPEYLETASSEESTSEVTQGGSSDGGRVVVARLNPDKEDITIRSIENFETEITQAGTIVLAGVLGKYEEEGHRLGTERIFAAVANSKAYKVVGGGDSVVAVYMLGLSDRFDWVSVGGGAMLEYLVAGTLPGIEVLC
ncbi:hypothetical protein A2188_01840 [Candidatus Woesebacteria bacterium RIFOXYA1_FULL_43_9]|uniref:Phosphoglycerate kinase n=1 Tax=Candidatus Woesebacteria bacterium RIFOXYA1_FULL_43_9 TaxID=1802534 RepID=A0A1F8CL07_9BACT|nr:MAG: hypothetical protein A2188_01840 [Candidatus Woesebacteria bacterium RIFOXYA1_FULL_43_9]